MKKVIGVIVVMLVAVILILALAKDIIIKTSVEKGVKHVTGLQLNLKGLKVGVIKTLIDIKGLTLFNPPGYKDEIMVEIPEIYVDYDLPAILKGKIHLEEMRLNVKELIVVKNEKGDLNLNSLKSVQEQKEDEKPKEEEKIKKEGKEKGKAPEMQIDILELKVGKVVYKDYSKGKPPSTKEFNINLDKKYTNITDPQALVNLIVGQALANTAIATIVDFDLKGLQGVLPGGVKAVEKTAGETLKKTAGELKKILKLPFGTTEEKK